MDNLAGSFLPMGTLPPQDLHSLPIQKKQVVHQKFSPQEDEFLKKVVDNLGTSDWNAVSRAFGNVRTPRQCRERWKNYLSPGLNKAPWTDEEDQLLFQLYQQFGAQWVKISKQFSGRTDINVKNRWVTKFKRNTSGGSTTTYTPGTSITPLQSNSGIHIQIPTTEIIQDKDLSIPNNPIDSTLPSESISEMQSISVPNQQYDQSKEPHASDSISIEPNQNEESK